jgi:hypothetical protein
MTKEPSVLSESAAKTNDILGVGADVVDQGATGGKRAMVAVAKVSTDAAVKGSAISTAKALKGVAKIVKAGGIVSGGIDAGVAATDFVKAMNSDHMDAVQVKATYVKVLVKTTIFAIGFSNPVTGVALGIIDAFGGPDWLADKISIW